MVSAPPKLWKRSGSHQMTGKSTSWKALSYNQVNESYFWVKLFYFMSRWISLSFRLNVGWISKCENRAMAICNMVDALLIYEISWALAESLVWSSRNMKYWFLACCFLHQPSRWLIFYDTRGDTTGNCLFAAYNNVPFLEIVNKKNLLFLYEIKAFKISQDPHLIFNGTIYVGVFFTKMAVL